MKNTLVYNAELVRELFETIFVDITIDIHECYKITTICVPYIIHIIYYLHTAATIKKLIMSVEIVFEMENLIKRILKIYIIL